MYDTKLCSTEGIRVASEMFLGIEGHGSVSVVFRSNRNKRGQECHDCVVERHHCSMMHCSHQFGMTHTHVTLSECFGKW